LNVSSCPLQLYHLALWQGYSLYLSHFTQVNVGDTTDMQHFRECVFPEGFHTDQAQLSMKVDDGSLLLVGKHMMMGLQVGIFICATHLSFTHLTDCFSKVSLAGNFRYMSFMSRSMVNGLHLYSFYPKRFTVLPHIIK